MKSVNRLRLCRFKDFFFFTSFSQPYDLKLLYFKLQSHHWEFPLTSSTAVVIGHTEFELTILAFAAIGHKCLHEDIRQCYVDQTGLNQVTAHTGVAGVRIDAYNPSLGTHRLGF